MVFLKLPWNINAGWQRLPRFRDVTFVELTNENGVTGLYKMRATLLYSTKAVRKFRPTIPAKSKLASSNRESTTFDRFLVFGSLNITVMFSQSSGQTKTLMRFPNMIRPGDDVWIIRPTNPSYLAPQTPEVSTDEPLIPCQTALLPYFRLDQWRMCLLTTMFI